ncbi:GNAT family N-acetyltransferase [Pedobacter sp. SYP-B3415]|uniref:GNAT family N-acetyltransferase n=1 Tax=Pedobacter sp. SYP-B3415 TaxID=2496641 RepID=UPI00101C7AC5|nr:GNAT family protein [Pedobacter sp. SYP-B3415]
MVHLDDLSPNHARALQALADNPLIARNLKDVFPSPYHLADAEFFLRNIVPRQQGQTFGIFVNNVLAGVGSVLRQGDVYRRSAEIGYWLGQPFWGKGYATEAVRMLTEHAFSESGIQRIFAGVFSGNLASMRVLEKNSFVCEGIKKAAIFKGGVLLDEHCYARVKESDYGI